MEKHRQDMLITRSSNLSYNLAENYNLAYFALSEFKEKIKTFAGTSDNCVSCVQLKKCLTQTTESCFNANCAIHQVSITPEWPAKYSRIS